MPRNSLALVTGPSTGIGYELARCCANDGYDLIVCADAMEIEASGDDFRDAGASVEVIRADLGTEEGLPLSGRRWVTAISMC